MKTARALIVLFCFTGLARAEQPATSSPASRATTAPATRATAPPSAAAIADAIAAIRHVDLAGMAEQEQAIKKQDLNKAMKTLTAGGKVTLAALKSELAKIDQAGEKDDRFKLEAATVIWEIANLDEAQTIADIWAKAPASTQSNYVFYTAHLAAMTQDARAVPMLKAVLRDNKMLVPLPQHDMNLTYPMTQVMIWGAYGRKGLPVLLDVLKSSQDKAELQTATKLLTIAQYLPALPDIRKLARHNDPDVAGAAVRALGIFGHPDDFDFIMTGLSVSDPKMLTHYIYAAHEYGDMRAVPKLAALLDKPLDNPEYKNELLSVFSYLICPESVDLAIRKKDDEDPDVKAAFARLYKGLFKMAGLTEQEYVAASPDEKRAACQRVRQLLEAKYTMQPDDRTLGHEDLVKACGEWKANHRITGGNFKWVEDRHVDATATPADLEMLYDVYASVLARVSDEALDEANTFECIMIRVGRKRYRAEVGLTECVTPANQPAPNQTK